MKSKHFILSLLLLSFFGCSGQPSKNKEAKKSGNSLEWNTISSKIDDLVKDYQKLDIFSGVILVADNGTPVYNKAFGLANREKGIKNNMQTKFDIGSMNKTFTQVVVLKLMEEGKLKLDDPIGKYLTGIDAKAAEKSTINSLLNHTSGYGDYLTHEYNELPLNEKTFEKTLARVKKMPIEYEPDTDQVYSNIGYILLGAIIEKVSNKSYFDNVQEIILTPLQLNSTSMNPKGNVQDMAVGYFRTVDDQLVSNDGFIEYPKPDGGFRSTAADIIKFYNEFHYGNTILKMDTKLQDEFFKAIQPHAKTGGAIPHAGGYPGANTVKYEILRDKISILVFANMNEPVAERLGAGILALVRGQEPEKPSYPAIPNVYKHYKKYGLEYVKESFENLTVNFHPTDPRSIILNEVGYFYLNEKDSVDDAIALFKLNTEFFGEDDPNVWDSLGEAYYKNGQKQEALKAYQNAISIDPQFPSSIRMIKKINEES